MSNGSVKKPATNTVDICHGKFVYSSTSGSIYVSAVKQGSDINAGFIMPKDMYVESSGTSRYISAHSSGKRELGGFSIGKHLYIPDGHIIKLVNNRKRNGREYLNAALLILVHSSAGIITVDASLPRDTSNCIGPMIQVYMGSGIVLSNSDVEYLGWGMNRMFINKYRNQEELDEAFTIDRLHSGVTIDDFTSVTKANGVIEVMAKRIQRKRKIILQ